jgi:hypothetical protein
MLCICNNNSMVEIIVHFPIILTNIDKTFFFWVRPSTNYFVLNIRCKEGIYTWKKTLKH